MCQCVRFCPGDTYIASTTKPFATKLGMKVHHHEQKFSLKEVDCYLQVGQGPSVGLGPQKMTICPISSELLLFLEINLV